MSRLAEAVVRTTKKGPLCAVRLMLDGGLPAAEAADLKALLADPSVTSTSIARALAAIGHSASADPIQRHRRGDCVCPR